MKSFRRHKNFDARSFITAFVLILFLTTWKFKLIVASVLSLMLTLIVYGESLLNRNASMNFHVFGYAELWFAGIVWFGVIFLFVRRGRKFFLKSKQSDVLRIKKLDKSIFVFRRLDFLFILIFVFVAIESPLLVQYDPSFQGDLRTTRLLKPLENVTMPATLSFSPVQSESKTESSPLEHLLKSVNTFLVTRSNVQQDDSGSLATWNFPLGTDNVGRDVLSRTMYGMRISLFIGLATMLCSVFLGSVIGFTSGFTKYSWFDHFLMRITDLFLGVPPLFLVIAMMAFFGSSTLLLIVVLTLTGWMHIARLVRGEVLSLKQREFILAARLLGKSPLQIVRSHLLPNVIPTIIVASVLQLGNVILAEAALSFLGLGIQPPTPSLGNMIGESLAYIKVGWWVGVFPGVALSLFLLSVNSFAEFAEKNVQVILSLGYDQPSL